MNKLKIVFICLLGVLLSGCDLSPYTTNSDKNGVVIVNRWTGSTFRVGKKSRLELEDISLKDYRAAQKIKKWGKNTIPGKKIYTNLESKYRAGKLYYDVEIGSKEYDDKINNLSMESITNFLKIEDLKKKEKLSKAEKKELAELNRKDKSLDREISALQIKRSKFFANFRSKQRYSGKINVLLTDSDNFTIAEIPLAVSSFTGSVDNNSRLASLNYKGKLEIPFDLVKSIKGYSLSWSLG